MKKNQLLILICINALIFNSCKKSNDNPNAKPSSSNIELKIDPVKKRFVTANGSGHYSGLFSGPKDIHTFNFKVEDGKSYRIMTSQPYLDYCSITLILLNSNLDTLSISDDIWSDKRIMLFNPRFNGDVTLKVSLNRNINSDFHYFLILENIDTYYPLNWSGRKWISNGDWRISPTGSLSFYGEKSGIYRWLKLDTSEMFQYSTSFLCRAANGKGKTKVGIAVNGSAQYETNYYLTNYNLPLNATTFVVDNNGDYNYIDGNNIDSGGKSYFSTTDINEWRSFGAQSPSGSFSGANSWWDLICNGIPYQMHTNAKRGYFLIVIEDKTIDKLEFDNFRIK